MQYLHLECHFDRSTYSLMHHIYLHTSAMYNLLTPRYKNKELLSVFLLYVALHRKSIRTVKRVRWNTKRRFKRRIYRSYIRYLWMVYILMHIQFLIQPAIKQHDQERRKKRNKTQKKKKRLDAMYIWIWIELWCSFCARWHKESFFTVRE